MFGRDKNVSGSNFVLEISLKVLVSLVLANRYGIDRLREESLD